MRVVKRLEFGGECGDVKVYKSVFFYNTCYNKFMPKTQYNPNAPQSKKKLDVYSGYLSAYLNIILNGPFSKEVHIYDMLAGIGKYGKTPGSAIVALDVIRELLPHFPNKKVYLHLNEYQRKSYKALLRNIDPKPDWVDCTNKDVNVAIESFLSNNPYNKFEIFYLDPFGYTQIKRVSIDRIMKRPTAECFLFVPVSRIAQYVKREKSLEEQEECIAGFLREYKIDIQKIDVQKIKLKDWGELIKEALAKIYSGKHVGMATLPTEKRNHNYALYFIGNHIYGLKEFVENLNRIEDAEKGQLLLLSEADENFKSDLREYLSKERISQDLYMWGLKQGWSRSRIDEILDDLKKVGSLIMSDTHGGTKGCDNSYLCYKNHRILPKFYVRIMQ